jgi:superfamily II DNA or RNA helicase
MLSRALQHDVPHQTRVKGADYFHRGAVRKVQRTDRGVTAIVRGTFDYVVSIDHESGGFVGSCECPYFSDRGSVCKHIWAVLLAPETEAALAAAGPIPRRAWIEPAAPLPSTNGAREGAPTASATDRRESWQHFLSEVQRTSDTGSDAAHGMRRLQAQIVYLIDVPASVARGGAELSVLSRSRKRDGEWTRPKPLSLATHEIDQLADLQDREILSLLRGGERAWSYLPGAPVYPQPHHYNLKGPLQERVLPLVARTGRAHAAPAGRDGAFTPIGMDDGAPWEFELLVTPARPSGFRIDGVLKRDVERMPVGEPLLVLDGGFVIARSSMARLTGGADLPWLMQLRRSGPVLVPENGAARLAETLARSGLPPDAFPPELRYTIQRVAPRPSVRIRRQPTDFAYGRENLDALVQFDYDGTLVSGEEPAIYDDQRRVLVRRDRDAEQLAFEHLGELGFRKSWSPAEGRQTLGIAADQFPRAVRTLVQEGWRVEAEGRVFRAPRGMQVEVRSGIDWFELHGRVDFGDGNTASLPALLAAFERGDGTVVLDDGTRGLVPEEWLQRFAGIVSFGETDGEFVRYRQSQASLLDALLAAQPAIAVDEVFARARAALQSFSGIGPLDPPESFRGHLREYQREALGWLEFLRRFGFGGCLADDMGLGKTVMVLALLESRRQGPGTRVQGPEDSGPEDSRPPAPGPRSPSLVVVPRSLVFNWIEEAARFAPEMRVLDYTGTDRSTELVKDHDLVLTTYGTLRRDAAHLKDIEFDYVILDEAQAIKNATTASSKAARLLQGRHRLALSGTPVENHVGELWSLFDFLNPGLLGTATAFQQGAGVRARSDRSDLELLSRAIRPFILRRTKQQVAPELPERTEQTIHCELDDAQRKLYDDLRDRYRRTLLAQVDRDGLNKSKMQVLEALLRLRQAACHPALVDQRRGADSSAKFDVLLPRLAELVEDGYKALVFSQFTTLLGLLRPRLEASGIVYEYLDGRTRDRAARVERFQNDPDCRVFLISLKAGGLGLNLTAAEYVFLLDPWWNPAAEAQAIDRAHRIGQTRHVFAYRLIARDTVEEKVAELQQSKRELADAILTADAGLIRSLSREDLEWLVG